MSFKNFLLLLLGAVVLLAVPSKPSDLLPDEKPHKPDKLSHQSLPHKGYPSFEGTQPEHEHEPHYEPPYKHPPHGGYPPAREAEVEVDGSHSPPYYRPPYHKPPYHGPPY
ncbi:early nodule-specific protein 2-like [Malania oleifera]|uniref:early nodule-specific protein 2-like n=1 Tax=Malania oleifera TaxID=397392 RepID=UPI0025ADA1B2|nr:early nodule-specific protein 2-like [Malania oleifera]